jgi:hypothetical protein
LIAINIFKFLRLIIISKDNPRLSDCSGKPTARYERGLGAESATRRGRPKF